MSADHGSQERSFNVLAISASSELFPQVLGLAARNRRTLGFLPDQAFEDQAERGYLLACIDPGQIVVAYVLFNLTRDRRVRITQLCVAKDQRGRGLARHLVELLSRRYNEYFGITLKCRRDFPENRMWEKLGFVPVHEVPGRGSPPKPLTVWWRSNGHSDLFSEVVADAPKLRVALDSNVFFDLHNRSRRGFEESSSLLADWLSDQLELIVTSQVVVEIDRLPDAQDRVNQRLALGEYSSPSPSANFVQELYEQLRLRVGEEAYKRDASLHSDTKQVASSVASGATVLVTRDSRAIEALRLPALELYGLQILRPSEILIHLDELANSVAYRPVDILRTGYEHREASTKLSETTLARFLNQGDRERKSDFFRSWRNFSAAPDVWRRQLITDPQGNVVAVFVAGRPEGLSTYEIPLLRCLEGSLELTLSSQILLLLRLQACEVGARVLHVTDRALSPAALVSLEKEGFFAVSNGELVTPVADLSEDHDRVLQWVRDLLPEEISARILEIDPISMVQGIGAADLEHRLWPLKVLDAELPTYIVPIQPAWSYELFGFPEGLLDRPHHLGLSREHIYYRSPTPRVVKERPGRILWYVSGKGRDRIGAIIGCSQLREVVESSPEDLYRRFRHLGVWKLSQILKTSKEGVASAFRFGDTEIFETRVTYESLRSLLPGCRTPTLQSPIRIDKATFGQIYRIGRGRR